MVINAELEPPNQAARYSLHLSEIGVVVVVLGVVVVGARNPSASPSQSLVAAKSRQVAWGS